VLAYLDERQAVGASQTEIAAFLGVHKSTGLRLLASFESFGLVARDPTTGRYYLGLGVVALAGSVLGHLSILRIADPQLRRLAEDTRQTVNLGVRFYDEILNIEQIPAPDVQRSPDWLGRRAALHTGAAAKALLAHLGEAERSRYLHTVAVTHPQIDARLLDADLASIRARGFAINLGEVDVAVAAIGAPIFDAANRCVASISIAWFPGHQPSAALDERIAKLAGPLQPTTRTISRQLGHTNGHTAWLA
jgi:IclR family acetate operon transcriptional repressor